MEFLKNLKYVWSYSKSEYKKIILYILMGIVSIVMSLISPIIFARLVVNLTQNKIKQFIYMIIIVNIIYIFEDFINYFKSIIYDKIFVNIYTKIQVDLGREILKLNNKTLEEKNSGIFIQRLLNDTENISKIFTDFNTSLNEIISNIGILVIYFIISKPIFIFIILMLIMRFLLDSKRINIYTSNKKAYRKDLDKTTGFASEIIRGAEDIKMLNGEESFLSNLKNRFDKLNIQNYNLKKTNYLFILVRACMTDIGYLIECIMIALSVLTNKISIPNGVVLFNFGTSYNGLIYSITNLHELVKNFNISATRVFDIFESNEYEKETFGNTHLDKVKGDFEFKNVSFKYNKKKVLKNVSFNVMHDKTVAFVGKSGSGKSTIFKLLCKMYDNYTGKITIDGIDIKKLDKTSIRGNITIVSQNPYIFNMSIKDNLKIVKNDVTFKEIKEACKMACLDKFIESLPEKYDTIVGEGGVNLSGGQKQRLAIARAFIQKTEIILFDEATSSLDNETQLNIEKAIENLKKDFTILIIAHRLSTIKNADKIYLIDDGKIIDEGTHKELYEKSEEYKKLYEIEFK